MIAFTEYVQDRQIRGVRKQISSYQGMERGMWSDYSKDTGCFPGVIEIF